MKYYYEIKKNLNGGHMYGMTCKLVDHPAAKSCTLFMIGDKGLGVIEQKFSETFKAAYWGPIRDELCDVIYLHPRFLDYFNAHAQYISFMDGAILPGENGQYPVVPLRKLMWALRMKPLKRQEWENWFS